jgi:hypothetical protein
MKLFTIALLVTIPFFISSCISCSHHIDYGSSTTTTTTETVVGSDSLKTKNDTLNKVYPTIGKVLKTTYFDFIVNKIKVTENIDIIKGFINVESDRGTRFLILYLTVKNNDKADLKAFRNGEIWVYKNDMKYKYGTTGTVKIEGDGLNLSITKRGEKQSTVLIYKIPKTMTGSAYFLPSPLIGNERISLGNI